MNNASLILRNGVIVAAALLGLSACSTDMDGLDSYINTIKARPGGDPAGRSRFVRA